MPGKPPQGERDAQLSATEGGASEAEGEKRNVKRQRTLKDGKVVLSDWSTVDCTIRDLSDGGAKLVFGGPTTLPATLALLINSTGTLTPAELLWQRGLSAGVGFTGPARPAPPRK